MSVIIELYSGPGAGKSTTAAGIYYKLKDRGLNAELVREYVKNWAWEGRSPGPYDQIYFIGKQTRAESMLYGRADFIVTDCPILLGCIYSDRYSPPLIAKGIKQMAIAIYNQSADEGHIRVPILLHRTKPYQQEGRFQDEEAARVLDQDVRRLLLDVKLKAMDSGTDPYDIDKIVDLVTSGM